MPTLVARDMGTARALLKSNTGGVKLLVQDMLPENDMSALSAKWEKVIHTGINDAFLNLWFRLP